MRCLKRVTKIMCAIALVAPATSSLSGCSTETGREPDTSVQEAFERGNDVTEPAASAMDTQPAEVLHTADLEGVGTLTVIDEEPASEEPSLSVMLAATEADHYALPLQHDDGTPITPYEYLLSVDATMAVSPRVIKHHELTSGSAVRSIVYNAAPETSSGDCDRWQAYFNGEASSFGGVGTPAHVMDTTTSPATFQSHGYLGYYSRIVTGACFVSQGDGNGDLSVRMQRRTGQSNWSTISGTQRTLHTAGMNRYLYLSSSSCSSYARRITVGGLPAGGIHPPDVFHMSGAWGGTPNGCWITSLAN